MSSKSVRKSKSIEERIPLKAKKTDYNIPVFGVKSALVILGGAVLGTFVVPMILSLVGASKEMGIVIGSMMVSPVGIAYSRCFIETKQGLNKKFFMIYVGFGAVFTLISIYWMYKGIYI